MNNFDSLLCWLVTVLHAFRGVLTYALPIMLYVFWFTFRLQTRLQVTFQPEGQALFGIFCIVFHSLGASQVTR